MEGIRRDVFLMPGLTGSRGESFRRSSFPGREGIWARTRRISHGAAAIFLREPKWLHVLHALSVPHAAGEVDALVVARAKRGDQAAFADIVRHYDHRLRALAFRLLGDRDRMDDALQEAYVKAFRSLPRFKGASALGTWLYRITYNACIDELRRGSAGAQVTADADNAASVADPRPGPEEIAVGRYDLAAALDRLPPEQRAVVLLVDGYGLGYADAADVLGIRAGTVGSRLSRARAALREALGAEAQR